jgi:hypothetical protein
MPADMSVDYKLAVFQGKSLASSGCDVTQDPNYPVYVPDHGPWLKLSSSQWEASGWIHTFAWLGLASGLVYLRYCFTLWVPGSIEFESPIPFEVSGAKPDHVSLFYQAVHVSWYTISMEVMHKSMFGHVSCLCSTTTDFSWHTYTWASQKSILFQFIAKFLVHVQWNSGLKIPHIM